MNESKLLSTESIIESAHIAAGVYDMLDAGVRARADRLLGYFCGSGPYGVAVTLALRRQIIKILARRLGIDADIARHPEILDEKIERPIFVIGFPRTGTSILQNLLAADPGARGVTAWRTREPSPPPGERPVAPMRKSFAADEVKRLVERCPGLITMHPYWDDGAESLVEDDEIVSLDFRTTYPTLLYDIPSLGYRATDDDADGNYQFTKLFLQHQQWNCPKRRWVMKGVDHQRYLTALFKVFPDARCIFPHREPADFMPSNLAIGAVTYDGLTNGSITRKAFGVIAFEDFKTRLEVMMADPALDDPRVTHIKFKPFIKDPIGTLRSCYQEWGFDWTAEAEAAMRAWLADPNHDGDRYGRGHYTFAPFGVDWEEQAPLFDAYRARFLEPDDVGSNRFAIRSNV